MFTKRGTTGNSAERRGRGEQTIQSLEKMAPGTVTDVPFYTALNNFAEVSLEFPHTAPAAFAPPASPQGCSR